MLPKSSFVLNIIVHLLPWVQFQNSSQSQIDGHRYSYRTHVQRVRLTICSKRFCTNIVKSCAFSGTSPLSAMVYISVIIWIQANVSDVWLRLKVVDEVVIHVVCDDLPRCQFSKYATAHSQSLTVKYKRLAVKSIFFWIPENNFRVIAHEHWKIQPHEIGR